MNWMILPYKRYFDFSGRSRRMEYWMFSLLWVIIAVVFDASIFATMPSAEALQSGATMGSFGVAGMILGLLGLASFIPSLAVTVRRLHDTNRSGWWWFIQLIPLIGFIVMLVFLVSDGTPGPNDYGPDPKGGEANAFT
jgi:uncharacterized membrane protein YhaH (DUF805 family)